MISPPIPANDAARVAHLRALGVLDTPPEPDYDELTRLAAHICQVPIALISLIDADRQWFKSCIGLTSTETSRDISFCAHAIAEPQRRRIIELLAPGERSVNDVARLLCMAQPTASKHLKVLREAGLITGQRRGTWVYYWVIPAALQQLSAVLLVEASSTAADVPQETAV